MIESNLQRLRSETGRRVVVVADEQNGSLDIPDIFEVMHTNSETLGLYSPEDAAWRCGDYCLYRTFVNFPGFDNYWLIEYDVVINSNNLLNFFNGTAASKSADLITAWFVESSIEWQWHSTISPFSKRVFNCMLQLSRFSNSALKRLFERRKLLSALYIREGFPANRWPNDEAFVGAVIGSGNFEVVRFADHAPLYDTTDTFTFTRPTSARWIERQLFNDSIYHPVSSGEVFYQRVLAFFREQLYNDNTLTNLKAWLPLAGEQLCVELGVERSKMFLLEADQMMIKRAPL